MESSGCTFHNSIDNLVPAQALVPSICDQNNIHILTLVENVESTENVSGKQSIIKKLFPCEYCLTWYASEKDLHNHVAQKHSTQVICKENIDNNKMQCMMCSMTFDNNEELDKHINAHAERLYDKATANLNDSNSSAIYSNNSNQELNLPDQNNIWINNLHDNNAESGLSSTNDLSGESNERTNISPGAKRLAVKRSLKRELLGDEEFRRRMAESQRRTRAKRKEKLGESAFRQEMAMKQRQTRERRRQKLLQSSKSFEEMSCSSSVTSSTPTVSVQPNYNGETERIVQETLEKLAKNQRDRYNSTASRANKKAELGEEGYRLWMAEQQRRTRAKKKERLGEQQYRAEMAEKQRKTRARRRFRKLLLADIKRTELCLPVVSACIFSSTRHATGVPCGNRIGHLPPDYIKLSELSTNDQLILNINSFAPLELRSVCTERALIFNRAGLEDKFTDNEVVCVWHRYHYGIGFLRRPVCCHPLHIKKESPDNSQDAGDFQSTETRPAEESLSLTIASKFNVHYPIGQSICTECYNIELNNFNTVQTLAPTCDTIINQHQQPLTTTIYVTTAANDPNVYSLSSVPGTEPQTVVKSPTQSSPYVSYGYITNGHEGLQQLTALNSATILATSGGKTFTLPVVYVHIDDSVTKQEPVSHELKHSAIVATEDYTSNRLIPLQSESPPNNPVIAASSKVVESHHLPPPCE